MPLSAFTHFEAGPTPLVVNHQGQFPAVTISFNLAPGSSLGDAVTAIDKARRGNRDAGQYRRRRSRAPRRRSRASLTNEPLLILAALVTVYIVLGVLYESYIHPITILSTLPSAGVGAILALMICGMDLSVIALIGIILLIGIVQEERDHDDRLRARGRARRRQAAARGDLSGVPAALPADHDDDDGGAARRRCRWRWARGIGSELRRPLGIAIVGGLICQPGADALHDAGDLS